MQLHHELRWKELYSEAADLMFIHVLPDDGGLHSDTLWANLHQQIYRPSPAIRSKSLPEPQFSFPFEFPS